ncbi:MAG: penicillin-binding protein 1A [Gemmatimonadaceae bacterium]
MPRFLPKFSNRTKRILAFTAVFLIAFGGGLAYGSWALVCREWACPSVAVLEDFSPRQTSKLFAIDGRFIAEVGLERRTLIKLGDVPKSLRDAFVITEDKRFYDHAGIDWYRIVGAAVYNVRAGSWAQGFSTITMQLARNVFPERISRDKTLTRKIKEGKVSRDIEARYSKDKILELYLNQIYLGNGAHGVETAAQRYFGKSARDLNLSEAALLAALPKAPTRYDPRRFPDRAIQRRNTIIELMRREGAISDEDARLAKAYPLRLARREQSGEFAPYFVEWVRKHLDDQFGARLYNDGLRVFTTLDIDMQSAAERSIEAQLRAIEAGKYGRFTHVSYETYTAREALGDESGGNSPYLQAAFIALDARTGAVRALVGGRDFGDSKFNRATQALRQPGSTFKPIVYSDAVRNGMSAAYMLNDAPIAIPLPEGGEYSPQNYDANFEGPIPMRRALYLSRNVPAVRMGRELGEGSVIDMARRFGLTTPIPPFPSIFLGAADVYPLELVAAYTTFATLGVRSQPYAILRVENANGEVLWQANPSRTSVLAPQEAWLMVDMLQDVVRRGTAYGAVWGQGFRVPAGGKTGTTNDGTDVWFVGFTPDLVAGVWMGFDEPKKIKANAQGGQLAAPAWTSFMTEVYQRRATPQAWARPEEIVAVEIDRSTGLLRNPFCPTDVVGYEYFIDGTQPMRECDVHSPFTIFTPDSGLIAPPAGKETIPLPRARTDTARAIPNPFKIP